MLTKTITIDVPFEIVIDELDWGTSKEYLAELTDLESVSVLGNNEQEVIEKMKENIREHLIEQTRAFEHGVVIQRALATFLANRRVINALKNTETKEEIVVALETVRDGALKQVELIKQKNGL